MDAEFGELRRKLDSRVFEENLDSPRPLDLTPRGQRTFQADLSAEFSELKKHLNSIVQRSQEEQLSQVERVDRRTSEVDQKIKMLAERVRDVVDAQNSKIKSLNQRVRDSHADENRLRKLIDKHNQIINANEVKMDQLQKIIDEQEIKIISLSTTLRDAIRTIEKLKRI